jgi:hypothetical protein
MIQKVVFSLTILTYSFAGLAQKLSDVVYVSYSTLPSTKVLGDESIEWSLQRFDVTINASVKVKDTTWRIFPFVGYTNSKMNFKSVNNRILPTSDFDLHSIRGGFNIINNVTEKWAVLISTGVSFRSDFTSSSNSDSFFPGLLVAANRKFNRRFSILAGVALNNDFGRDLLLPYFGFFYRSKDNKFSSELFFPNLHITVRPYPWLELGFSGSFDATIHAINSLVLTNNSNAEFHRMQIVSFGPSLGVRLMKQFWLNVRAGYTLLRENEFLDKDFNNQMQTNLNGEDSWFVRGVISYRLN